MSDALSRSYGAAEGLRYAMMIVMIVFVPAGLFLLRAGKRLKSDMKD